MDPLKPIVGADDLQTAASEILVPVPLAFKDNSAIRDEILEENSD